MMATVLGQRTCGPEIKVGIELAKIGQEDGEPWWNNCRRDAALKSSHGGDEATCSWQKFEVATWKEL